MAEGPDAPQREDDPRDTRIKQQDREISRLRGDLAEVNRDRDRWKRHSERLQQQLDTARRAGFRQAAPFAKDRPQGCGGRPGRRAGARYGRQACRRRPAQVDETHAAPVPAACPDCGGAIEVTRVASQYQEEIPEVRPIVRRFDIEVGHCSRCQRRVQGRHALQTSDALGAAGAQLGPGVVALVVEGRIPDFPVTRSHPPASWPSAANSSICRTYRKTAGEESRRRSPVANRWMRP